MKKVLIVDDSSYMRMFIKKVINKEGSYMAFEAIDKENAIEMFKTIKPDIVTLDLNISEVKNDGIEVLKNILEIDPKAIVIIVSAAGYENFRDECIELGAKTYIKKPIDTEVLLKTLAEHSN